MAYQISVSCTKIKIDFLLFWFCFYSQYKTTILGRICKPNIVDFDVGSTVLTVIIRLSNNYTNNLDIH